jgi:hypothetical protein
MIVLCCARSAVTSHTRVGKLLRMPICLCINSDGGIIDVR